MKLKTFSHHVLFVMVISLSGGLASQAFALGGSALKSADEMKSVQEVPGLVQGQSANEKDILHQVGQDKNSNQMHAVGTESHKPILEKYAPPFNFSSFGHNIDWLFQYTSWVSFVFFLIMAFALFGFVILYRERPGHKAEYTKGLEKKTTMVTKFLDLAVFITLDSVLLLASFRDATAYIWKAPENPKAVKVMIMPQQWAWKFRYAGNDGIFNTADDVITTNEMKIPRALPILIQMKSKDVIHGLFIPNARIQMDAIPGQVSKMWFDAHRTGIYEIACYHMCGTAHYKMKAFLDVMEENDFNDWVKEKSNWAAAAYDAEDKAVHWGWDWGI